MLHYTEKTQVTRKYGPNDIQTDNVTLHITTEDLLPKAVASDLVKAIVESPIFFDDNACQYWTFDNHVGAWWFSVHRIYNACRDYDVEVWFD